MACLDIIKRLDLILVTVQSAEKTAETQRQSMLHKLDDLTVLIDSIEKKEEEK